MVAYSLTEVMETSLLFSFFGAKKHSFGARQPSAAMIASVLAACIGRVKCLSPTSPPFDSIYYWCACSLVCSSLFLGMIIGVSIFCGRMVHRHAPERHRARTRPQ
eukprot:2141999-Pyramimonas_sp.AAC.1